MNASIAEFLDFWLPASLEKGIRARRGRRRTPAGGLRAYFRNKNRRRTGAKWHTFPLREPPPDLPIRRPSGPFCPRAFAPQDTARAVPRNTFSTPNRSCMDFEKSGEGPNGTCLDLEKSGGSPSRTCLDVRQSGESLNMTRLDLRRSGGRPNMTRLDLSQSGASPNMTRFDFNKSSESPNMTCLDAKKSAESPNMSCFEVLFPAVRRNYRRLAIGDWRLAIGDWRLAIEGVRRCGAADRV